jgi:hypothetical protein
MKYQNIHVDERYTPILEPNLYSDNIFQPGVTFNQAFAAGNPGAGLVRVYKQNPEPLVKPGAPAQKFTHADAVNSLLDIRLNNAFRVSRAIYQVQANSIAYALADQTLAEAVAGVKQGWTVSGLACLIREGTPLASTAPVTAANIKATILDARRAARKAKAAPSVVLASVDVFSAMLEAAGSEFAPGLNDSMMATGQVGTWLGMTWFECNATEERDASYFDHAGDLQTADLSKAEFVMYDPAAFSIINNLELMRVVDSENFAGSLAQVEFNTGYRVTGPARVTVKKRA